MIMEDALCVPARQEVDSWLTHVLVSADDS